ncbi:MAG: cytochrome-c peroxidase [Planctomycetes bacterium]|nr:cytochrome-c peroxidase [Planctomycetota bacterium]
MIKTCLSVVCAALMTTAGLWAQQQYYMAPQVVSYPATSAPAQNTTTAAKAVLGKMLFWDEQLSHDDTMACGTCHVPSAGGVDTRVTSALAQHPGPDGQFNTPDDRTGSPGVVSSVVGGSHLNDGIFYPRRQVTGRRAPTFIDRGHEDMLFWDGRADDVFRDPATGAILISSGAALENLALQPLLNSAEMGCQSRVAGHVVAKLQATTPLRLATNLTPDIQGALSVNPTYAALFQNAFGSPAITATRIAYSIAAYLRTLRADQTPFDVAVASIGGTLPFGGLTTLPGLTAQQNQGLADFRVRCVACHAMPFFGSQSFTTTNNVSFSSAHAVAGLNDPNEDPGRYFVNGNISDYGSVKIPSLRNVGLREPFGLTRTGRYDTLEAVVDSYALGGSFTNNVSSIVANRGNPTFALSAFSQAEKTAIVDFLRNALTDPRVAQELPPFDRPTLGSELGHEPTIMGSGNQGSGGFEPVSVATQPPALGTYQYTVGVGDVLGGSIAVLALNTMPALPGAMLAPGVPLHVATTPSPITVVVSTSGQGSGNGVASLTMQLPPQPSLVGFHIFGQWFVVDAMAPGGIAATPGFQMTLF